MVSDVIYLRQLLQRGHCCSVALAEVGLRYKGSANPELLDALKALCNGVQSGFLCGALSGAACMISLLDPKAAAEGAVTELGEWFDDTYGSRYGGINCHDIIRENPYNRALVCPQIIEETYLQAKQILEYYGFLFTKEGFD